MHSKWLGWAQYLYGTIFWMLCHEQVLQSPLENLVRLGSFIRGWQSRNPCNNKYSQSLNKLSMFVKQKDYPKLRGKACEIQDLSPCILAMWQRFGDCTSEEGRQVLLLLQLNEQQDTFLKRSDRNRYALSEEEGNTLVSVTSVWHFVFGCVSIYRDVFFNNFEKRILLPKEDASIQGDEILILYVQLSESRAEENRKLFNVTGKMHATMHTVLLAKHIHPALTACFQGEDFMAKAGQLLFSCTIGVKRLAASKKVAEKYQVAMHFALKTCQ